MTLHFNCLMLVLSALVYISDALRQDVSEIRTALDQEMEGNTSTQRGERINTASPCPNGLDGFVKTCESVNMDFLVELSRNSAKQRLPLGPPSCRDSDSIDLDKCKQDICADYYTIGAVSNVISGVYHVQCGVDDSKKFCSATTGSTCQLPPCTGEPRWLAYKLFNTRILKKHKKHNCGPKKYYPDLSPSSYHDCSRYYQAEDGSFVQCKPPRYTGDKCIRTACACTFVTPFWCDMENYFDPLA